MKETFEVREYKHALFAYWGIWDNEKNNWIADRLQPNLPVISIDKEHIERGCQMMNDGEIQWDIIREQ